MSLSFSLHQEEQASLFSRESLFDPSFPGLGTSELRFPSHDEPRSEGYDEYFDPPLDYKYECPICLFGLREPVQTSCGHRFCRGCILRSIRDAGPKCPVDNEPLSEAQLYPDKFVEREMMSHDVFCRMKKQRGCPWKGPLSELEKHLNECPFVDVKCPTECGKELQRKDLQQHLEKDCPLRKVPCKYCKELKLWNALENHYKDCPKYPQQCDNCGKQNIPREKMDEHLGKECPIAEIQCPFVVVGCTFESHMDSCEFHKIPCVHYECGMQAKKANLTEHLEKECKCRLEICGFCTRQINLNRMKLHHEKECPAYQVKCEKCKKENIPRAMLLQHQDPIMGCDAVQGPCPFSQIGCSKTEVLSRDQKKEHMEQENASHTTLILHLAVPLGKNVEALLMRDPRTVSRNPHISTNYDGVIADVLAQVQTQAGETRDLREKWREQSERITTLERKVASGNLSGANSSYAEVAGDSTTGAQNPELTRRVTNLENRTADHEVLLEEERRDMGNIKRQLDTNKESVRRQERRIESIEHTLALRNVTLADLEEYVRQQEFSCYDGQLLWKISDYARRRNDAVTGQQVPFYSPCFYTSRYGYKMCVRLYLNGDGEGQGTHISISLVVMRGQYDMFLRWPFKPMVTFMLLDQNNLEHVIDTSELSPFHKPRSEAYVASGRPLFCPLSELNNHVYVRDDTMFLHIVVDTTDL